LFLDTGPFAALLTVVDRKQFPPEICLNAY
jgi:hypothetical protein